MTLADKPPLAVDAGTSRTLTCGKLSCWKRKPLKDSSSRRCTHTHPQPLPQCPSPLLRPIRCPAPTGHTHPTSEPLLAPLPSLCLTTRTACTVPWHRQRVSLPVCSSVCLSALGMAICLSVCLYICLPSVCLSVFHLAGCMLVTLNAFCLVY